MANEMVGVEKDIVPGFGSKRGLDLLWNYGKLFAESSIVPDTFRGNQGNCVIALNMAIRMNADPLMVMQNLFLVYGKPSWSSQFLISTFNSCGRFTALRYEWFGKQGSDDYGCKAWAVEKATGEKLEGATVTIWLAKKEGWYSKNGSKWQTMPQQMLMYRAASWFIRAYAPEIAMGLQTNDEVIDTVELEPNEYEIKQTINNHANKQEIKLPEEKVVNVTPEKPKQEEASNNKKDRITDVTEPDEAPIPSMF